MNAKAIYKDITSRIKGRLAMKQEDALFLAGIIEEAGPGDYIEIGSLYGGSAIFTELIKRELGYVGSVITIDPLIGYYGQEFRFDPGGGANLPPDTLFKNFDIFDVAEIIHIKAYSYPWPLAGSQCAVFLIDGDHSINALERDFESAARTSTGFILIHDYDDPNIKNFADHVPPGEWNKYKNTDSMIAFKKGGNK